MKCEKCGKKVRKSEIYSSFYYCEYCQETYDYEEEAQ